MPRLQSSLFCTLTLSLVCVVISSQSANATPFALGTGVGANLGCVPATCQPDNSGDHDADFTIPGPDNGAGYVSVSDQTDAYSDTAFTYFAQADSAFGILHAGASGSYDLSSSSTRDAFAFAYVVDQLTLTGGTGSGTLDISFLLDGVLKGTDGGGGAMFAAVGWGPNAELFGDGNQYQVSQYATSGTLHDNPVPSGPIVFSVSFDWDKPLYLQLALAVGAGTPLSSLLDCNGGDACLTPTTGTGSGTVDFFHTMVLTGLVAKDANGNPVDAQFSSGSGATYSVEGIVAQPVPEPASLLLLATGGMALAHKRRRRI